LDEHLFLPIPSNFPVLFRLKFGNEYIYAANLKFYIMKNLALVSVICTILTLASCSKNDENVNQDMATKHEPVGNMETFDLSYCPNGEMDCCAGPAADCGPAADIPAAAQKLGDLVTGGQNGNDNSGEIRTYFEHKVHDHFTLSSEITSNIVNSTGILKFYVYSNNYANYFQLEENGERILVLPVLK
jgi:hypothetical protein